MTVRVVCPNPDCGQVGNVTEASLGRRGRCRKCGRDFDLAPDAPEVAPADPGAAPTGEEAAPWSPPPAPIGLPEQFGRYRIIRPIGQGGMGAVYLAQDTVLGRAVALKVPRFAPAEAVQAIPRFVREARAAATLDHPNLCPVFDVGEVDGAYYLTMPFIAGKPLAEALGRGRTVTEAQAAAVARKLALALQEAHDRGVVHRDLKPGNIMVNRRRELVIMDFGLARLADGDGDANESAITRPGHILGTALYMAPEQATGSPEAGHPAVDVYSLGVILYELLTGVRPFEGPWSLVIGLKSVQDPASPTVHRPDLAPTLAAICVKALARRPEDRYTSMAEFARALSDFLAVAPGPAPPAPGSPLPDQDQDPDRLAAQVFAGLNSREATSLDAIEAGEGWRGALAGVGSPRRPRLAWIAGGAAAALILGVLLFVTTNRGRGTIRRVDGELAPRLARATPAAAGPAEARPPSPPPPPVQVTAAPSDPADGTLLTPPTPADPAPAPADAPPPGGAPTLTEPPASPLMPGEESAAPPVEPAARSRSQPKKKATWPIPARVLFADGRLDGRLEQHLNGKGATRWSIEGGLLVAQGPRGKLFLFRESFRDFDLHAEVMRGDNDSTGVLVFRAGERDEGEKERMCGYSLGLGRAIDTGKPDFAANFDPCAETGSISLWKFLPGRSKLLQAGTARRPAPHQWFTVDVQVRGNLVQARFNNGPPVAAIDPAGLYPTGQVGFKAIGGPDGSTLKIRRIEIRPVE